MRVSITARIPDKDTQKRRAYIKCNVKQVTIRNYKGVAIYAYIEYTDGQPATQHNMAFFDIVVMDE